MGGDPQKSKQVKKTSVKRRKLKLENNSNIEDRRRTRSQGPPSMSEENELIQWGSLQDPVRIEREHAEACRLDREANTVTSVSKNLVESSEISQAVSKQALYTDHTSQSGKISPKQQGHEGHIHITPKSGKIPPNQREENSIIKTTSNLNKIPPKESHEVADLVAMEEGQEQKPPTRTHNTCLMGSTMYRATRTYSRSHHR